jgi:hypothetical protein
MAGSCEHGNEPSSTVKGGEFLDKLGDCQLLKKDVASWSLFAGFKKLSEYLSLVFAGTHHVKMLV